jgi:adiponectin receptor
MSESIDESLIVVNRDDPRLPPVMRIPFIHIGYRLPQPTIYHCLHSGCTSLHNQSASVHTHLWPALIVLVRAFVALVYTLPAIAPDASAFERLCWFLFFSAVVTCFAFSAAFHSLLSHRDERVRRIGQQMDYCGILLLIGQTNFLSFFVGFQCHPVLQTLYSIVAVSLLVIGIYLQVFAGWWHHAHSRGRLVVFLVSACFGFVPLAHWRLLSGGRASTSIVADILSFYALFAAAFAFYSSHWPEKIWRNWITELFLSGHVLWHIGSACAVLYYIEIVLQFRQYRQVRGCSEELGIDNES